MVKFNALLLATFAALGSAGVAAENVPYSFSGIANGSVNGADFTAQAYTFSLTADSSTVQNGTYPFTNVLTSGTITITGTACAAGCTITSAGTYAVFNLGPTQANVHGLSLANAIDVPGSTYIEGCWECASQPVNDNLVTGVPPTASGAEGGLAPYPAFATSGGPVLLTLLGSHITYAVNLPIATVPALSNCSLVLLTLLLGSAAVIAVQRRRA
jgi:hypothetical protein